MLRLYVNQNWGTVRTESRSFAAADGELLAGTDERALFPLFGFKLPAGSYPLATWHGEEVHLFPPPEARVEHSRKGGPLLPLFEGDLQGEPGQRYLTLTAGSKVRMREGDQLLTVVLEDQKDRAGWDKQKAVFMLVFMVVATVALPLLLLMAGPDPRLVGRALEEARVKQGLPAHPQPIDLGPAKEGAATGHREDGGKGEKGPTHVVLPASVR